jgi:hypothetical protein
VLAGIDRARCAGGQDELADRFRSAFAAEAEHLQRVRAWIAAGQQRTGAAAVG